ncbi:DUF5326 family protein [Streptomyces bambusae]|uniref:DUF5326 family protein n=1 Tax=Streptomyces bambusae TaxID=1550616 RepID=UPI001CFD2F4F|nr:DUF5326 family protein [Streptomyces bambusae]MCB5163287.1 DUF5326 family protein [Streptomyces bambusae]
MDGFRETFASMPWWVKWVGIPVIALFVFGGMLASLLSTLIGFAFNVLLFAALVGGLVYLVKMFGGAKPKTSRTDF